MPKPLRVSPAPAQVRTPQQARSRRTREAVLAAAVVCFEENGYEATSTAAIAARAGVAVGTVYSYFRDKRAILMELVDSTVKELAEHVIGGLEPHSWQGSDPRETVRSLIDAVFHSQQLRPGMQRIMWERFFKDPEFRGPVESIQQRTREAILGFLEAVRPADLRPGLDLETASFVILNAVQWNATRAFMDEAPQLLDIRAAATCEMIARFVFRDAG